jgi:hypothetical protein
VIPEATTEEAVFSVGAASWLYNEDLRQLELELRESLELAIGRNGKKGIRLCKEDFTGCCSDSETVINPLQRYDY